MPIDVVMEGYGQTYDYKEIDHNGVKLLVEPLDISSGRIVRVLSTNPKDFLDLSLNPGTVIKYKI